jgi:hypothetical protein
MGVIPTFQENGCRKCFVGNYNFLGGKASGDSEVKLLVAIQNNNTICIEIWGLSKRGD